MPQELLRQNQKALTANLVLIAGVMIIAAAVLTYILSRNITRPLDRLMDTMEKIKNGNTDLRAEIQNKDEIRMLGQNFNEMLDRVEELAEKEKTSTYLLGQAKYHALQAQINPHFLYNTLESIRGQALLDDNLEIARMVEALAAFFRYSISRKGNLVTLRDELANIDNYMMIQRYRFNNRFSMEIIIDEEDEAAYDFLIPRLIIQPVVENAIFHGLEEKLEEGKVTIEVIVTEQNLIITISDNGTGIESKKLAILNARIHDRNIQLEDGRNSNQRNTGIALPNIHKRIQLLFGEEYGVNIYSTVGQGTDVEITIPANYQRGRGMEDEERDFTDQ